MALLAVGKALLRQRWDEGRPSTSSSTPPVSQSRTDRWQSTAYARMPKFSGHNGNVRRRMEEEKPVTGGQRSETVRRLD